MVPKGIRQKITLGFYVLLLCIVAMAGLTYGIVHEVGNKLESLDYHQLLVNALKHTRHLLRMK